MGKKALVYPEYEVECLASRAKKFKRRAVNLLDGVSNKVLRTRVTAAHVKLSKRGLPKGIRSLKYMSKELLIQLCMFYEHQCKVKAEVKSKSLLADSNTTFEETVPLLGAEDTVIDIPFIPHKGPDDYPNYNPESLVDKLLKRM